MHQHSHKHEQISGCKVYSCEEFWWSVIENFGKSIYGQGILKGINEIHVPQLMMLFICLVSVNAVVNIVFLKIQVCTYLKIMPCQ